MYSHLPVWMMPRKHADHLDATLQTAHVGALYSAFLAMMLTAGVPPVIAALSLGFMSNLFGSITHFGSGQGAVYYGAGAGSTCSLKGGLYPGLCRTLAFARLHKAEIALQTCHARQTLLFMPESCLNANSAGVP